MRPMTKHPRTHELNEVVVNSENLTLLVAVEQIANLVEDSALSKEFFAKAKPCIDHLTQRLKITDTQAVILSVAASFYGEWCSLAEYASYMACRRLQMLHYMEDLMSLRKRRFIRIHNRNNKESYQISKEALESIRKDKNIEPTNISGLTIVDFFERITTLVGQRKDEEITFDDFVEEVKDMMRENAALPFVATLKSYDLCDSDLALFLWACNMLVSDNDPTILPYDYEDLYAGVHGLMRAQNAAFRSKKSPLFEKGLMRPKNEDGMGRPEAIELTAFVRNEMLAGLDVETESEESRGIISCSSITPKSLFYNPKEERSLSQLRSLLEPEQFDSICSRLEAKGLRRGFACLFYGGPGAGKTETVLQLARQTGRDLVQVNISDIKSMWVGESEKNIKKVFDSYRKLVRDSDRAPILFFNEADAILGKRMENVQRSVDKMENSMQNIILQEVENLEGILIATTNLTKNLDSAFERRFLYKIEFAKPSEEAKRAIWQSMLPSLSEADAKMLATKYDFSGGQIENITRKQAVEEILTGCPTDIDRLIEFCNDERLDNSTARPRIGY